MCVNGESRFLRVGGLGFYEVAVGFYKVVVGFYEVAAGLYDMAVGVLGNIKHSQNYDNYTLTYLCTCMLGHPTLNQC